MILFMTSESMISILKSEPKTFQEAVLKRVVQMDQNKEMAKEQKAQSIIQEDLEKTLKGKTLTITG